MDLNKDVKYIKGVGPNRVKLLNKIGVFTLEDLISYYPRTYQDRSKPRSLCDFIDGEEGLIEAVVVSKLNSFRIKGKTMQKMIVRDETDSCTITWFNQPYLKNQFKVGEKYSFYGKIKIKSGAYSMNSPTFDPENINKNTGRIIPIYPVTYQLSQNTLRKIMENAIKEVYGNLEESLPEYMLKKYKLQSINETIKHIHFPDKLEDFNIARNRLVFEELLTVQLALLEMKNFYIVGENRN